MFHTSQQYRIFCLSVTISSHSQKGFFVESRTVETYWPCRQTQCKRYSYFLLVQATIKTWLPHKQKDEVRSLNQPIKTNKLIHVSINTSKVLFQLPPFPPPWKDLKINCPWNRQVYRKAFGLSIWGCTHSTIFFYLQEGNFMWFNWMKGFPGGSEVKASACNEGDLGSIPGSGRSPGEGNGNPLQYSCLENPMEGGAW